MSEIEKLMDSFEKACEDKEFETVEEIIQQLQKKAGKNKDFNLNYSHAIAKTIETFKGKISSTKLKGLMNNIEKIITKDPKNDDLAVNFAKILRHSLVAMSSKGQPKSMKDIISNLENLASENPGNITIQEQLSEASHEIVHFWKKRGDYKAVRERTIKFRELAEKYPENENIKINLSKALVHEIDSSSKRDIKNLDSLLSEIKLLSESMPHNIGMQLEWVHAYRTAMDRAVEKPEDAKRWLTSMKEIAATQKDDEFKVELAKGYINTLISLGNQNIEETKKYLDELEALADTAKEVQEIQSIYAESLVLSLQIFGIEDYKHVQDILKELRELVDSFPENQTILETYIKSLVGVLGALVQLQKADEMAVIVEQLEEMDEKYSENKFVQQTIDQVNTILNMVGFKKEEKEEKKKKKRRGLGFI